MFSGDEFLITPLLKQLFDGLGVLLWVCSYAVSNQVVRPDIHITNKTVGCRIKTLSISCDLLTKLLITAVIHRISLWCSEYSGFAMI